MRKAALLWALALHALGANSSLFISDGDTGVLDLQRVDEFRTLPLSYEIYKQWAHMAITDKLPFLVDTYFVRNIRDDFLSLATHYDRAVEGPAESTAILQIPVILQDNMISALGEFQGEEDLRRFFSYCDADRDGLLGWAEYLLCRGDFDKHGTPAGRGEYDYLEDIVISDFYEQLTDPNSPLALELIARGEL